MPVFAYGDTTSTIIGGKAANQHLSSFFVAGDAPTITGSGRGGNDYVEGVFAYGDAQTLSGHARGGDDDVVTHTPGTDDWFRSVGVGDALTMSGHARGGDDILIATGGVDYSSGFNSVDNELVGDGFTMSGRTRGGNDTLYGANSLRNVMYGDGWEMYDHARGGDDILVAGGSGSLANFMYGDAVWMADGTRGGDDILISGASYDLMYGDHSSSREEIGFEPTSAIGGHDTFVFMPNNGDDIIGDFHHGEDKIDLRAFGFSGFNDLHITVLSDGSSVIDLGSGSVHVMDVVLLQMGIEQTPLTAGDFIF